MKWILNGTTHNDKFHFNVHKLNILIWQNDFILISAATDFQKTKFYWR